MSENIAELTSNNFEERTSKGNWVVDFWAAWCGPCKMMAPVFEETAKEMKGKVSFGKVDVDSESDLAQLYGVMSIPTLIFFKNGKVINRAVGLIDKDSLKEAAAESF